MATYQGDDGTTWAKLELQFDKNTELDMGYYVVAISQDNVKWQEQRVTHEDAPDPVVCTFLGLTPGASYYARVKSVDTAGNESAWALFHSGSPITMPSDTVAPGTPANLMVTAAKKSIRIQVDKNTEGDWAGNQFHVSTQNGFIPSGSTLVHSGKTTSLTHPTTSYVTHYVKVRAYDTSGNFSGYTSQGSATPEQIDGTNDIPSNNIPGNRIQNLGIGTAQIGNAAITTAKIDALAVINAKIDSVSASKLTAGSITVNVEVAGASGLIKSSNYFPGSVGWQIDKDGDAEFNSVLIRAGQSGAIEVTHAQGLKFNNIGGVPVYVAQYSSGSLIIGGSCHMGALFVDSAAATFGGDIYCPAANKIVESTGPYLQNITIDATTVGLSGEWNINQIVDVNALEIDGTEVISNTPQLRNCTIDAATVSLDADWDIGNYNLRARTFQSDVATGTAPLTVASTTKVTNLHADKVDNTEIDGYYAGAVSATGHVTIYIGGTAYYLLAYT